MYELMELGDNDLLDLLLDRKSLPPDLDQGDVQHLLSLLKQ